MVSLVEQRKLLESVRTFQKIQKIKKSRLSGYLLKRTEPIYITSHRPDELEANSLNEDDFHKDGLLEASHELTKTSNVRLHFKFESPLLLMDLLIEGAKEDLKNLFEGRDLLERATKAGFDGVVISSNTISSSRNILIQLNEQGLEVVNKGSRSALKR